MTKLAIGSSPADAEDGSRRLFRCPGCEVVHQIDVSTWSCDDYLERPTISPSILVRGGRHGSAHVCHSFVTDGRIQFLDDSTHALAGQTVDLPEWPPGSSA